MFNQLNYCENPIYQTNKDKSSLTSLVACFILGKVYCKAELNEDDDMAMEDKFPKQVCWRL